MTTDSDPTMTPTLTLITALLIAPLAALHAADVTNSIETR